MISPKSLAVIVPYLKEERLKASIAPKRRDCTKTQNRRMEGHGPFPKIHTPSYCES